MPKFPENLPLPQKDGYKLKPQSGVKKTEMTSGLPRLRLITRNAPTNIPVVWHFTEWEFGLFEAWYLYEAKEGAAWFDIKLRGGLGLTEHKARFMGESYEASLDKQMNKWIVTTTLQVLVMPRLSVGGYQLLTNYGIEDIKQAEELMTRTTNNFFNKI